MPHQAVSRLSFHPEAHYAVPRKALWKKAVWRIVSAPPSQATPGPCATPSVPRWPTLTIRVGARAIPARPAAATSWCWSASIAQRTTGRWPASSNATCASTTTSRFGTSAPPATRHRPASYATCSTRHSIRFGLPRRRSRSVATQPPGSTSFGASLASTSKARSTADRITGPSGAGIGRALVKTSGRAGRRPRSRRAGRDLPARRPGLLNSVATVSSPARGLSAGPATAHAQVAADPRSVAHARADQATLHSAAHVQVDRATRHSAAPVRADRTTRRSAAHGPAARTDGPGAAADRIGQEGVPPDQPAPAKALHARQPTRTHERAH